MKLSIKKFIIQKICKRSLPISLSKDVNCQHNLLTINVNPKSICTINFDDLSPVIGTLFTLERGGSIEKSVTKFQEQLLYLFPYIAITHFTIPNCIPSDFLKLTNKNKYRICNSINHKWLYYYKNLSSKFNIEYALHGYYHRQFENLFFSRHTEFSYLSKDETINVLRLGKKCFNEAGFVSIGFRQPGWDFNSNFSLIEALIEEKFEYAGLSSYNAGLNANMQRVSFDYPTLINNKLISFPDNINLDWPIEMMKKRVDDLVKIKGCIIIKGHFVEKKYMNSFSYFNFHKLCQLLEYMKLNYNNDIDYLTFEQATNKIKSNLNII